MSNADGLTDDGKSGRFNPSFPGTFPYVTSVGGTQIKPGASVTAPEEAVQTVVHSGGGFSNVFPLPSFQSSAVKSYFTNHKPSYTAAQYNNSQTTRGYPDISANAANYAVALNGKIQLVYGTSASCPTVASIITLINEQRVNAGKKSVGYINPTLYANPTMFNDIVTGGNAGTFYSQSQAASRNTHHNNTLESPSNASMLSIPETSCLSSSTIWSALVL